MGRLEPDDALSLHQSLDYAVHVSDAPHRQAIAAAMAWGSRLGIASGVGAATTDAGIGMTEAEPASRFAQGLEGGRAATLTQGADSRVQRPMA